MATTGAMRFLERNRFFDGQRLFASDLQSVESFNREMRWLHNQSLHQPGIGSGFAITGAKGAREVVVQPGYAIDAEGREIVLAETVVEPVPPVADDGWGQPVYFDLTVSYPDERTLKASETRDGVCAPRGTIRLRESPVFCWVRLGPPPDFLATDAGLNQAIQDGLRLRLARARVLNCQLERPLSLAQRRNAKPTAQPYVASGSVLPAWSIAADAATSPVGVQITANVDTRAAGFRTPPCYSAHVRGDRQFTFAAGTLTVQRLLDGFTTLTPTAAGFDLSVLIPDALFTRFPETPENPDPRKSPTFKDQLNEQLNAGWHVDWIGVEG